MFHNLNVNSSSISMMIFIDSFNIVAVEIWENNDAAKQSPDFGIKMLVVCTVR